MPSQGYLWNLNEWMKRLGLNRQDQPPIAYGIQPTLNMGDASALTTPLLPPLAWSGGQSGNQGAQFSGFSVRSLAPGGSFLRSVRATVGVATNAWTWTVGEARHVYTSGEVAFPLRQMGPEDCTAEVRGGRSTPALGQATRPNSVNNQNMTLFIDEFYLNPGAEMYIEFNAANFNCNFAVLIQDVPVGVPAEVP